MNEDMVRPFSTGTQYLDWRDANCCRCRKYRVEGGEVVEPYCELEEALAPAALDGGLIEPGHAARLGVPAATWTAWRCREFEPATGGGDE